jgi:hypothetical protein
MIRPLMPSSDTIERETLTICPFRLKVSSMWCHRSASARSQRTEKAILQQLRTLRGFECAQGCPISEG